MRTGLTRALLLVALLATPLAAAPEPPRPGLAEDLPRVVFNFLSKVENNVRNLLGLPTGSRGPDFVTRDILLGAEPGSTKDYDRLRSLGVTSVLDMRGEKADDREALDARGIRYKRVEVVDYEAPTPEQLREAVEWIRSEVAAGRRVYVHCRAGIGRSATVVAAFLMSEYGWTRERAWSFLESRRPIVRQTDGQRESLVSFERERSSISRTRGASGLLDRAFDRTLTDRLRDLETTRVRDALRERVR